MAKDIPGPPLPPLLHKNELIESVFIQEFVEAIDAIDNGISQYPTDIKAMYRSRTDLSSRIASLNPAWNQPTDPQTVDVTTLRYKMLNYILLLLFQAQFAKASLLTGEEFLGKLKYYANSWLPARDILVASITDSRQKVDPTGQIVLLEQFLPWKVRCVSLEDRYRHSYFIHRNIFLNSKTMPPRASHLGKLLILSIQTKLQATGVCKPSPLPLTVLRVERHFPKNGED